MAACLTAGCAKPVEATALFVKTDAATQGTWKGRYGGNGFAIAGEESSYPNYAVVKFAQTTALWVASTSDPRAVQKFMAPDRIAATWYTWSTLDIDIQLTDDRLHQVAMYFLDWDSKGRSESLELLDAVNNSVLDRRNVVDFADGKYLVWNLGGHVKVRMTRAAGPNAVVSGLFFGPVK